MKTKLSTKGMECRSCEQRIEGALKKLDGVKSVKSDYASETTEVEFDENKINEGDMKKAIEWLGFKAGSIGGIGPGSLAAKLSGGSSAAVSDNASSKFGNFAIALGAFAILIGAYMLFGSKVNLNFTNISPEAGFAALFVLGFLTGFHCIGMCGGFVLSCAKHVKKPGDNMPYFLYGAGKTISYTIIGALFGLLGSFIAFTTEMRAGVAVIAGAFLVVYGLNMLNIFPALRRLQLRVPSIIPMGDNGKHGPLYTGLLNGLMIACGPLQALYIFAAGTGSPIAGAQALLFFGLGTLAPLLTFGIASNFMSAAFSHNVVRFSGVLVVALGLMMAMNGLNLFGIGFAFGSTTVAGTTSNITNLTLDADGYQVINMNVTSSGFSPNSFVLKKGVPVRWKINGQQLNGCNNEILVRDYGLDIKLQSGLQTVEFTPNKTGTVRWSCWMGMIPGQFIVTEDGTLGVSGSQLPVSGNGTPATGHSCGGSGGGCGCGGGRR